MEKNYNNILNWHLEVDASNASGGFANSEANLFPGCHGDSAFITKAEDAAPVTEIAFCQEDYAYSVKKGNYFYGIKNDNTEVIAAVKGDNLVPVAAGAGKASLRDYKGRVLFAFEGVKGFEFDDNSVTVSYNTVMSKGYTVKAQNIYTFTENALLVKTVFSCVDFEAVCRIATFNRELLNTPKEYAKRLANKWIYPENNDYAFRDAEALALSEDYGDFTVFNFVRDENSPRRYNLRTVSNTAIPLYIPGKTNLEYEFKSAIVFQNNTADAAYLALFKGREMNFAAGIATVEKNENTTAFLGKDISLNLNVTNLSSDKCGYSVKYNIINYYGEEIESGVYYNNSLSAGESANRRLDLKLKDYGMYFLNFYVTDGISEHKETLTFSAVEEYDFKYRSENPFGICATHHETYDQGTSTLSLLNKMGMNLVRVGSSAPGEQSHKRLMENGMKYLMGYGHGGTNEGAKNRFISYLNAEDKEAVEKCTYYLIANEVDSPYKCNYESSKNFLEKHFIPNTYKPAREYFDKNFPEKGDIIWQSNCHGTYEWLEAFYDTGMWDASDLIDIHSYSSPSGPDKIFTNSLYSMHANTFSNEYAASRWKRLKRRYGEKRLIVAETGYPTAPDYANRLEVDIRTQADFNVRIAMFFLEAGAEAIVYYCMYDRTSVCTGAGEWNEMYFGAFYDYDYYGVYMPKPWSVAYSNLTRLTDGYAACRYNEKYEEGEFGTLRAFDVEMKDGTKFTTLWSNIYCLPNTTINGRVDKVERIPMPAWENRWVKTEARTFDAVSDEVRVVDIMGNEKIYKPEDGKVTLEISGSPVFVYGI